MPEETNPLEELLVDELKDLYSAENQIIKALPKMAKATSSPELRRAFERHLEETRTHAEVLGFSKVAKLLQQTLDEEGATDKKLTQLAESIINVEAAVAE